MRLIPERMRFSEELVLHHTSVILGLQTILFVGLMAKFKEQVMHYTLSKWMKALVLVFFAPPFKCVVFSKVGNVSSWALPRLCITAHWYQSILPQSKGNLLLIDNRRKRWALRQAEHRPPLQSHKMKHWLVMLHYSALSKGNCFISANCQDHGH